MFMETCVCYKECKPKETKESSAACKSPFKSGGAHKAKHKASKKAYHDWEQDSPRLDKSTVCASYKCSRAAISQLTTTSCA
eukprot:15031269-Ditylum_brightwellii.AAC.1